MITEKHIVFVLPAYKECSFEAFFDYAICQVNQAEALAAMSVKVSVVTRFKEEGYLEKKGVHYYFVKDAKKPVLKRWETSTKLIQQVERLQPDVAHFHGFIFPVLLTRFVKRIRTGSKVVVEYHSDPVFKKMKGLQRKSLKMVDRLIFANLDAATQWSKQLNLEEDHWRLNIECAPSDKFMDRTQARSITGFNGQPVFLWCSRLIARRDPITVIEGFEKFLQTSKYPESHFYWMIPDWDIALLTALKDKIASSELLTKATTLITERKPHHELAPFFNSADYLLSGSKEDGYGYAAADAMSCGVIPIVTDIATFRQITNNGEVGALWKAGDASHLTAVLEETIAQTYPSIKTSSNSVKSHFDASLSASAQANQLVKIYDELF